MKPGYTTTEFWLTLATQLLALLAIIHPGFKIDGTLVQSLATLAAAAASGLYALGRSHVKASVPAPAAVVTPDPPAPTP